MIKLMRVFNFQLDVSSVIYLVLPNALMQTRFRAEIIGRIYHDSIQFAQTSEPVNDHANVCVWVWVEIVEAFLGGERAEKNIN